MQLLCHFDKLIIFTSDCFEYLGGWSIKSLEISGKNDLKKPENAGMKYNIKKKKIVRGLRNNVSKY